MDPSSPPVIRTGGECSFEAHCTLDCILKAFSGVGYLEICSRGSCALTTALGRTVRLSSRS